MAFNSYIKSENYGAKFGQMKLLTHENVTLYGGVITCLLACDRYAILEDLLCISETSETVTESG